MSLAAGQVQYLCPAKPLPVPVTDVSAGRIGTGIVVTGRVEEENGNFAGATFRYDMNDDEWCLLRPKARDYLQSYDHGSAVVDDNLYLFGGVGSERVVQKLNVQLQEWEITDDNLPVPGAGVTAVEVDGIVYVCGGVSVPDTPTDDAVPSNFCAIWDPVHSVWDAEANNVPEMPEAVGFASGCRAGEWMYIIGGRTSL